jgi:hypothetical protein
MAKTNAQVVVEFGERIWGIGSWAGRMSDLTGVNLRTLTRIHAAVRDGVEYPAARGVIAALRDGLKEAGGFHEVLADLEPWARRADAARP